MACKTPKPCTLYVKAKPPGQQNKMVIAALFKRGYITKEERKALRDLTDAFDHAIHFEAAEEFGSGMIAPNRPMPPVARVNIRFDRRSKTVKK